MSDIRHCPNCGLYVIEHNDEYCCMCGFHMGDDPELPRTAGLAACIFFIGFLILILAPIILIILTGGKL